MKIYKKMLVVFSAATIALSSIPPVQSVLAADSLPTSAAVLETMKLVDNYWINNHVDAGGNTWDESVYHEGNLAAFDATQKLEYYEYTATHANTQNWLINNGQSTTHADWQSLGRVYLSLQQLAPAEYKSASIIANMDPVLQSSTSTAWSWVDALFMAMPVYLSLGKTYNSNYYEKMYQMYYDTKVTRNLYDSSSSLWYRDSRFIYDPNNSATQTPNGKKILWARGNGWVFAALATVMDELPTSDPHYSEYLTTFQNMAASLKDRQRSDGFWNSDLDDPDYYGGIETSGTAAFTYGMALGVRKGILDSASYLPTITKAWNGMVSTAVQSNGLLGYVQGVGDQPGATTSSNTRNFGVGLFLLAGSEVVKLASGYTPPVKVTIPSTESSKNQNVALKKSVTFSSEEVGNEASHVNNGNTVSRWSAQNFPQWAQIDLGSVIPISMTELFPYNNRPYKYKIEASTDGTTFTTLVDRTGNSNSSFVLTDKFNSTNARYVKLTVTGIADNSTQWVSIDEFKVHQTNFALNMPVSYSGQQTGNEAIKVVDGNSESTRWSSQTYPQWVVVDMGSIRSISKTQLYPYLTRRYQYKIEVSTDGNQYTTVVDKTANTTGGYVLTDTFTSVNARYVRLTVTGALSYLGGWASISELKLFAK